MGASDAFGKVDEMIARRFEADDDWFNAFFFVFISLNKIPISFIFKSENTLFIVNLEISISIVNELA